MPVFIQRFILPILAFVVTGICLLNPWKWDWRQRISLFVAVSSFAYFFAYTSYRSSAGTTKTAAPPAQLQHKTGDAGTSGDQSPAVTGDKNSVQYDQPSPPKNNKPAK